jgi:multidrug efflux pump subunit AcrA (membrane-fusion protein)
MTARKKKIAGSVILAVVILLVAGLAAYMVLGAKSAQGNSGPGGPGVPAGGQGPAAESGPPTRASAGGGAAPSGGMAAGRTAGSPNGFPFGSASSEPTVLAVRGWTVERGTVAEYIRINGDVVPRTKVSVYPDTAGRLISISVKVGDSVTKGSVIASIDPSRPGENYAPSPVFASVSGTVISLPVEPGERVTSSTAVVILGDLSRLRIETAVPERYVGSVRPGLPGILSFEPYPGETFAGHVTEISPVLDSATRTNPIALELNAPDAKIKAGMFATIRLIIRERRNVIRVPREAIITADDSVSVFVVENGGTARRKAITIGLQGEEMAEVTAGLEEGDIVVTQGQTLLSDGSLVRVVEQ